MEHSYNMKALKTSLCLIVATSLLIACKSDQRTVSYDTTLVENMQSTAPHVAENESL
jgi:uncharacterized protein YcfL